MHSQSSMQHARMKIIAGVILMCVASGASATTTLIGGGDTLPAVGYTANQTVPAPFTPITPGMGSLFLVYSTASGNPVTYCPSGGLTGKRILAGNDLTHFDVNAVCKNTVPNIQGFGGVGLSQPHFAAADAPLAVSEFNNYVAGHGAGTQPVQLPSVVGAIGIVFKKTGVTSMTLTEGQICGIFSGQISSWSDASLAGSVPAGLTGPITVVFQKDGSGTSFAFLNHLSAVCPSNVLPGKVAATAFKTSQNFSGNDFFGNPTGASAYVSAYALSSPLGGADGDPGVISTVNATEGSIGYAEVSNAVVGPAKVASVRNSHSTVVVNPITGFGPTAIPVSVVYDQALSDSVTVASGAVLGGRPIPVALTTTSHCIAMVKPDDYADPATGYPMLAVTYLLANAQGNGADVAAVRGLMFSPYNTVSRPSVTRIGRITTGYAWLSNADLTNTTGLSKVNSCIN